MEPVLEGGELSAAAPPDAGELAHWPCPDSRARFLVGRLNRDPKQLVTRGPFYSLLTCYWAVMII